MSKDLDKKSEKLDSNIQAVLKALSVAVNSYSNLDNPLFILETNYKNYTKEVKSYIKDLQNLLLNKYTDDYLLKQIEIADGTFFSTFSHYIKNNVLKTPKKTGSLIKPIYDKYYTEIKNQLGEIENRILQKKSDFVFLADANKIGKIKPDNREAVIDLKLNGKKNISITRNNLSNITNDVNKRFGYHSDIKYKTSANDNTGSNYPIKAHFDNKFNTLSADVDRSVMSARTNELGIYTVKVSSHNGKYSCALHEGQIIFVNSEAKAEMKRLYPKMAKSFENMSTVQDLKEDSTRIFKFNCSHTYRPYPLQFMDMPDIEEEVKENPNPSQKEMKNFEVVK